MSKKKLWEAPLIGGIAGVIYSISITQNYYDDYIVNFTNNLAPDAKGKVFTLIMHFIASYVGKVGLQIVLVAISMLLLYYAYSLFKKQKREEKDWQDYKNSRKKFYDRLKKD